MSEPTTPPRNQQQQEEGAGPIRRRRREPALMRVQPFPRHPLARVIVQESSSNSDSEEEEETYESFSHSSRISQLAQAAASSSSSSSQPPAELPQQVLDVFKNKEGIIQCTRSFSTLYKKSLDSIAQIRVELQKMEATRDAARNMFARSREVLFNTDKAIQRTIKQRDYQIPSTATDMCILCSVAPSSYEHCPPCPNCFKSPICSDSACVQAWNSFSHSPLFDKCPLCRSTIIEIS